MDVFISYRREGGLDFSSRLYERLTANGYTTFFDLEGMKAGRFDTQIYKRIERSDNFVLVLSPHALDRCDKPDDWVRLEIEKALELNKNIVLLFMQGFTFPDTLPSSLECIRHFQGIWYFYISNGFNTAYSQLLLFLKDKDGNPLVETKQKKTSNTYYETVGMKDAEKERIIKDYKICKDIESKIFEEMLTGKSGLLGISGVGKDLTTTDWQDYLLQMLQMGFIEIAYNDGNKVKVTDIGKDVLYGRKSAQLCIVDHSVKEERKKPKLKLEIPTITIPGLPPTTGIEDPKLFEALRALRLTCANEEGFPPYIVFSDKVLHALASIKPTTLEQFGNISGIGDHKKQKYGNRFVALIQKYV